jgi:dihydrofolate reductase
MIVSIIVAVSNNNVIGKNNNLIWHLPNDMKFFKESTKGHHVIMGRKNFESIPHKYRPLPNRTNIIITRKNNYIAEGCFIVNSMKEALKIAKQNKENEAFIIGGGEIYNLSLKLDIIDKIYLTQIDAEFDGDTFFPEIDFKWQETSRRKCKRDKYHAYNYDFITFEKI